MLSLLQNTTAMSSVANHNAEYLITLYHVRVAVDFPIFNLPRL